MWFPLFINKRTLIFFFCESVYALANVTYGTGLVLQSM